MGVRAVLVPHRDSSTGRDACSIASVLCKGASASLYVTLCTDNQRSCLFSEHCLALTAVSRRYTRSTATWQHRAPCKLPVICATADARIHSLALCRAFGERGADLACSRAFGIVYMETHIKTFVGTHICVLLRRVLGSDTSRPPGGAVRRAFLPGPLRPQFRFRRLAARSVPGGGGGGGDGCPCVPVPGGAAAQGRRGQGRGSGGRAGGRRRRRGGSAAAGRAGMAGRAVRAG